MNVWKHGLRAEKVVIAGEDAKDLQAIQRELWEEHQPAPGMESLLVERLAHYAWRMRRAAVFEAALLGDNDPGTLGYRDLNAISTRLRYEMALVNSSYRTLQQLLFFARSPARKGTSPHKEGRGTFPAVPQVASGIAVRRAKSAPCRSTFVPIVSCISTRNSHTLRITKRTQSPV